jgi:superfamily II DNA or RNA helicase
MIVVDECHHVPAVSFDGIVRKATARFVLGLTATPFRRDGLGELIMMRCGPIRHRFQMDSEVESLQRELVVRGTAFDPSLGDDAPIQLVYRALVGEEGRNRQVCTDVLDATARGRSCIVLTEWREHVDRLLAILEGAGARPVVLHGGVKKRERVRRVAELHAATPEKPVLVLATGALVGEGFDLPRLDTLVLAFPISYRGKIIQYAGRILRAHDGKRAVTVYDYCDELVTVLARMQTRRQKTLESVGFATT